MFHQTQCGLMDDEIEFEVSCHSTFKEIGRSLHLFHINVQSHIQGLEKTWIKYFVAIMFSS